MPGSLHSAFTGLALIPLLFAGCGGSESMASWAGEVRDSAGVRIVRSPAAPLWSPEESWWVEERLRIGGEGAPPEALFGYVSDVAVDAAGRVLVLDRQARAVRVFDPRGGYLATLGGPGEGPGELGPLPVSLLVRGDTVMVSDWTRNHLVRFDAGGAALPSLPLPAAPGARAWGRVGDDGALWFRVLERYTDVDGRWRGRDLLVRTRAGTRVDSVLAFDYRETDLGGPGTPRLPPVVNAPVWSLRPDGTVAWTSLDSDEIRIVRPAAGLETEVVARIRSESWRPRGPSEADRRALTLLVRERLEMLGSDGSAADEMPLGFPERLPVITGLRSGPERTLWVQRLGDLRAVHPMAVNSPDPPVGWGGTVWDVLDAEGRYLGSVELPPRMRVATITDSLVVGVQATPRNVDQVLLLEIRRPGDPS